MRGNDGVIEQLNKALAAELTTISQYIVHAEMCENWGYLALGGYIQKQAIGEMKHAEGLIARVLFLDGTPKVDIALTPNIGANVKAQLENDLKGELEAIQQYNAAAKVCLEAGDNGSRELFEQMIKDEEEHADFLEAQLHMIGEIGIENYLAQQMSAGSKG
ncbi:MAG: bacterioferritin [Bryobacteraceae bacterium]|nr:bacterioferritin [Bryobacteraceae bacterium]